MPNLALTDERPAAIPPPSPALFPSPRQVFLLLVVYFALQIVIRVVCSSSVDLDESEQVVLGQQFSLGYGSDPPLYTWMQIPLFRLLGESVLALSVLKNLLLFSIYALTFFTARLVTRQAGAAAVACLSVLYLPEIAWESQRDLTHSVLSAACAMWTLYCFLRLLEGRRTRWYLLFGISAGLGLLSKYNYAFWLVGLLFAAASLREFRGAIWNWRMLAGFFLAIGIFLPNGLWMLSHRDLALLTSNKFDVHQTSGWLPTVRLGTKHLVESIVGFGAPLVLIYCLVFWNARSTGANADESNRRYRALLLRAWLFIFVMLLGLVFFARATGFKERWFEPILIALPVLGASFVAYRLDALRLKLIAGLSLLIMVAVAVVMPGRLLAAERLKREEPLTRPYAQLAAQVRDVIPPGSLVVCDTRLLAGNLRLGLPDDRVLPPELVPLMGGARLHCVLAWDAGRSAGVPEVLQAWLRSARKELPPAAPQYFSATYRYHRTKQYRLGLVQVH